MHIPDFHAVRALIVGDLMLDRYWHGPTSRISPEAPVPVVRVSTIEDRLGGACNVAENLATLGVQTTVMGYCGKDEAGETLIGLLDRKGIRHEVLRLDHVPTIFKLRAISRHQQLLRLDFEERFHSLESAALLELFKARVREADVVILSDYDKGTLAAVESLIALCREAGKPVLIDPKGASFDKYRHADLITPNLGEFETVAGPCRSEAELVDKGQALLERLCLQGLLITRGEQGMTLLRQGQEPLHLPTQARDVFDVTGAGDTVIAVLAAGIAAGLPWAQATHLANLAAGIVVGKMGTSSVTPEELEAVVSQPTQHQGAIGLEALLKVLKTARAKGEKIVLTNGCFDILHPGHVRYLQQARALGDRLIVLVNSDASVRRLKGPERPINSLEDRMAVLAALACVDWVLPFEEDTPRDMICRLLPDILVKGGDYQNISDIAGHDCVLANGGEVKLLDFVDGHSTTRLIGMIRGEKA